MVKDNKSAHNTLITNSITTVLELKGGERLAQKDPIGPQQTKAHSLSAH